MYHSLAVKTAPINGTHRLKIYQNSIGLFVLKIQKGTQIQKVLSRRCSNYIFIFDLTLGFNRLGKDKCKTRRETIKFWDLVQLILEIWR